ncbi:MAG: hypothetical protein GY715_17560 [Planctomycetes bacterium]|nr:hypothetical protein [Planctomycetota bacterium]
MRSARTLALIGIAAVAAGAGVAAAGTVERRGALEPLHGKVSVSDDGVMVDRSFVPWDRVRRVETDGPEPALDRRLATAADLWRARSRVERGDFRLAEPLLERLFESTRGQSGVTRLVVAEGLLRCRLDRGANAAAVIPALETARLRRAGVRTVSYEGLRPVIDEATALCPQLAPAWIQSRALVKLERDLDGFDAAGDVILRRISECYHDAARHQLGQPPATREAPEATDHPGLALLRNVLDASAASSERREAVRKRLRRAIADDGGWREGWCRFALGVSLLHETGTGRRHRGLVELSHLPARFAGQLPYLAGLAVAWVEAVSRADGDTLTVAAMQQELARRFPNHPVRTATAPIRLPNAEGT